MREVKRPLASVGESVRGQTGGAGEGGGAAGGGAGEPLLVVVEPLHQQGRFTVRL